MDKVEFHDLQDLERAQQAESQRWRRYFTALSAFALGMLVVGIGFTLGDGEAGKSYREVLSWLIGAGFVCLAIGLSAMMMFKPNDNSRRLRALGSPRDRAQKQQAEAILIMPATSLYLTFKGAQGAWAVMAGTADLHDWMFALLGPCMSLMVLAMVAGLSQAGERRMRRFLDDELVRSFRKRSLMLAFGVLLAGFVGIFAVALWSPAAAISAMPLVLAVAASAAAIRYALLDHAADPNG